MRLHRLLQSAVLALILLSVSGCSVHQLRVRRQSLANLVVPRDYLGSHIAVYIDPALSELRANVRASSYAMSGIKYQLHMGPTIETAIMELMAGLADEVGYPTRPNSDAQSGLFFIFRLTGFSANLDVENQLTGFEADISTQLQIDVWVRGADGKRIAQQTIRGNGRGHTVGGRSAVSAELADAAGRAVNDAIRTIVTDIIRSPAVRATRL